MSAIQVARLHAATRAEGVAHEGWMVDPVTGEVLRELDTARRCCEPGCERPIERAGPSGRQPRRCDTHAAERRLAANAARRRRQTAFRREVHRDAGQWQAAWAAEHNGDDPFAGVLDATGDRKAARPGVTGTAYQALLDDLRVEADASLPLVPVHDHGRDVLPAGWYSRAGCDVGQTDTYSTAKDVESVALVHGRDGLHARAMSDPWWLEHASALDDVDTDPVPIARVRAQLADDAPADLRAAA